MRGLQLTEMNMESIKNRLVREAVICSVYFVISMLSAIWAYDRFIAFSVGDSNEGFDINLMGMIRIMWRHYLVPFICAFASLCALRFMSIVLLWYGRKRAIFSNQVQ
jgi:hypothetical protein